MADDDAQEEHVNGTSSPPPALAAVSTGANDDGNGRKEDTTVAEVGQVPMDTTKHKRTGTDPEAQEMVISSLKSQIQDLFSQVNELNNKLVKSYDRVSDLEDDIHVTSSNLRQSTLRISQLELERTQHLAALNTGLLVEKAHVTAELNRLMEKATEEAAQRGQAESARHAIEKDLDDLSATLFGQANTMVAEARYAQHLSERKVEGAERALKDAEEMVGLMQVQMQAMQEHKEQAEKRMKEMQEVMGKGKQRAWEQSTLDLVKQVKLLSSHVPYQEFMLFVAHLRSLHLSSLHPPAMATLLPLPFLARLATEDVEPTIRLDLAPALNWLSRRSVLSAIHSGQLTIEPIPVSALFSETTAYSSPTTIAGVSPNNDSVSCALCGAIILAAAEHTYQRRRPPSLTGGRNSWSGSFFKKTAAIAGSRPPSPNSSVTALQLSTSSSQSGTSPPQQVYVFRMASTQSTTSTISSALPLPAIAKSLSQGATSPSPGPSHSGYASAAASSSPNYQSMTIYPLCSSGWCLTRLRTTCELWSFVRTGIVDKVWEEEMPVIPTIPTSAAPSSAPTTTNNNSQSTSEKPPVPPRRRGLWGGIASAIGERASSWTGDSAEKKAAAAASATATPPPLAHPSAASHAPPPLPPRTESRRMPPPLPAKSRSSQAPDADSGVTTTVVPSTPTRGSRPPLPPRSGQRASVIGASGDIHDRGDGASTPTSNPASPMRVVFDMTHPQSPMRSGDKELPAESAQAGAEPHAPAPTSSAIPSPAPAPTPAAESVPPSAPTADVAENSPPPALTETPALLASTLPAQVPLPESRPTSPEAPARVASPAIAGVIANGAALTPPPLPRRAAARRAVPPPPGTVGASATGEVGSRPATPSKKVEEKEERAEEKAEGKIKKTVEAKVEKKVDEKPEDKEKVVEDKKEESQQEEEKKPVDTEQDEVLSSDEEFVDAIGVTSTPMSLSTSGGDTSANPVDGVLSIVASSTSAPTLKAVEEKTEKRRSFDTIKDAVGVLPSRTDEEEDAAVPGVNTSVLTPEDLEPSLATAATALGGIEERESKLDESDANSRHIEDGRDAKEVYVGDATWEERTWKEIVRLKEDMFWARVGGWRS